MKNNKKLGDILLEHDYITEGQLEEAIEIQKKTGQKIGEIFIEQGYLKEENLIEMLEYQKGIPSVNLDHYFFDTELAEFIPESIAKRHQAVALEEIDGKALKVAMSDPTDIVAIDDIERVSGLTVKPVIAAPSKIKEAINWIYADDSLDISDFLEEFEDYNEEDDNYGEDELLEMVEEAPIIKLANSIISRAYQRGASDIHIEPEDKYIRVRYRIDGVLQKEMTAPKSSHRALVSRFKIIADLDITEHRVPQDGKIRMLINGNQLDMRVSTLPTVHGEKVVVRLLAQDTNLLNINKLGFSDDNIEKFEHLIQKPHGIMLLTGPTGSGKSTTLFAGLNRINSPKINIVTIEDPVEYSIEGVYQVQAKPKSGLTFAKALRSILRQDPDVIMIGEMRDEETAEIGVRAALTGHLVFSTLHTNDAVSSVTRLVDMGLPPYLVASSVNGIVAQRLVRRLCSNCKKERELDKLDQQYVGDLAEMETAYYAVGCQKCNQNGYSGRLALQEIFIVDNELKDMIASGISEEQIEVVAREKGMRSLKEDGIEKIKNGETDIAEVRRIIF